jgi:hypothetical protein
MAMFNPGQAISDAVLPLGQYVWRVCSVKLDTSKKTGEGMAVIEVVPVAKLLDNDTAQPFSHSAGKTTEYLSYSPKAAAKLGRAFIAVGHFAAIDLDDARAMHGAFMGRHFAGGVQHEEYNGENRARLAGWRPLSEAVKAAYPDTPVSSAPSASVPGLGGGGAPRAAAPAFEEDDVPFMKVLVPMLGSLLALGVAASSFIA